MAERYSRLYSLTQNLYTEGSPVIVVAGALLLDNQTGKVLAQIKFKNISLKAIKAISVKITPTDIAGRPLSEPVSFQYLDFLLHRDNEYGQKQPIPLPNNQTRSFFVCATEVVYADNEIWTCGQAPWRPLSLPSPLTNWLPDVEMVKQYKMRFGQECFYVPARIGDLWYCTCGAINRKDEESCHICRKSFSTMVSVDLVQLTREKDVRLQRESEEEAARLKKEAEEKAATEERERKEAEERREEQKKKRKKRAIIISSACIILLLGAGVFSYFQFIKPAYEYQQAEDLAAQGEYEEAITIFESLGNYKDSAEKVKETKYVQGFILMGSNDFDAAYEVFSELGDYKESPVMLQEVDYLKAMALFEEEKYEAAIEIFETLGDYRDSKTKVKEVLYQKGNVQIQDTNSLYHLFLAFTTFNQITDYSDAKEKMEQALIKLVNLQLTSHFTEGSFPDDLNQSQQMIVYNTVITYINDNIDRSFSEWKSNSGNVWKVLNTLPYGFEDRNALLNIFKVLDSCYANDTVYQNNKVAFNNVWDTALRENIMNNQSILMGFLRGHWTTSDGYYYFDMNEDHSISYNLPYPDHPDTYYYYIDNYLIYFGANEDHHLYKAFDFTMTSPNEIDIYCFEDGKTYTLYRH